MQIGASGTINALLASTLNNVYQQNKTAEILEDENDESAVTDSLTISQDAQNLLSIEGMFGTKPGEAVTLEDIKSFADEQLVEFNREFKALLRKNNIDTSIPITLGHEEGTGRIIVQNEHPDAEKVEGLFSDNFDLRNKYTAITNALGLVKHAEEHLKFSEAYANGPQAAVAQYSYLFNMRLGPEITFDDELYSISYNHTLK
ncbi:MAG: hypothetical protein PVG93_01790 [Phycisphaerales bacterium]|jgi:hypothetical protein